MLMLTVIKFQKLLEQLATIKVAASINALGAVANVNFTPGSISVQSELDICRIVQWVSRFAFPLGLLSTALSYIVPLMGQLLTPSPGAPRRAAVLYPP